MDVQEALFASTLAIFYSAIFLIYATIGNLLVGHKTSKTEDVLFPFSKDFRHHFGTRDRPTLFYYLYYIFFLFLLGLFSSKVMSLRSSFRTWVDKMMGTEPRRVTIVSPVSSHTSLSDQDLSGGSTSQIESTSNTSVAAKDSKSKKKKASRKEGKKKEEYKKAKIPSVMRSSVVDPRNPIIPSKTNTSDTNLTSVPYDSSQTLLPRPSQTKPSTRKGKSKDRSKEKLNKK